MKDICELVQSAEGREQAIEKIVAFGGKPPATRFYLMQLLISEGMDVGATALIDCALGAFERLRAKAPADPNFYYNIANGYQSLYEAKVRVDPLCVFDCEGLVSNALKYFGKASVDDPRVLTNLGNLYDSIGRPVEAIRQYERALAIDENFGMAIGNKAYAVEVLAGISGYPVTYRIYAHQLYEAAIDVASTVLDIGGEEALAFFQARNDEIIRQFTEAGECELLTTDLAHEHYDIAGHGELVKFYTDFCVEHDLYLNLHIYAQTASASVGDAVLPRIVTRGASGDAEQYFTDIAFRLNEIHESYMTARVALAQSQYTNVEFSTISEQTTLINTADNAASNIYVGYLKTAYKEAFSTLDKVAVLLNHYLEIGHPEDSVYYHTVWYEPREVNSEEPPVIAQGVRKQGYRLLGLYLLCRDLRGSRYSRLRNALTHRYARVYRGNERPKGTYTFNELSELTVDVMFKVKCAVMYATLFIERCEVAKGASLDGPIGEIRQSTDQHLDSW